MNRILVVSIALLLIPTIWSDPVIESANDGSPHISMYQMLVQPIAGDYQTQIETGVKIRRISDVAKIKTALSESFSKWEGSKTQGLTNGYSRFPCVSVDGNYILAFGTSPLAVLFRQSDLQPLGILQSKIDATGKIGDLQETKWSGDKANPHLVGYIQSSKYYRQDVSTSPSFSRITPIETAWGDFGGLTVSTSDGDWDNAGRIIAEKVQLTSKTFGVRALKDGTLLPWTISDPNLSINGVDVSPSGKFVKVDNYFYDNASGGFRNRNEPGHGGWAIGLDGREFFVNQNSRTDWIEAFSPETSETLYLMRMGGWAGIHVASDKRGVVKGWALVSTYSTSQTDPLANNVFFVELKSQKPGLTHPYYGHTTTVQWNAKSDPARLVRVCAMQHLYTAESYFTEGWASLCADGNIYWGGNWHGRDNLELYRAEMPADLSALLLGGTAAQPTPGPISSPTPVPIPSPASATLNASQGWQITLTSAGGSVRQDGPATATLAKIEAAPTPGPVEQATEFYVGAIINGQPYPYGPKGYQANYYNTATDSFGFSTWGDYHPFGSMDPVLKVWQNGYWDTGAMFYFNLSAIPTGAKIISAQLGLSGSNAKTEYGNAPTGRERIPLKPILNPKGYLDIWESAFIKPGLSGAQESDWNGASSRLWNETENKPWSDLPTQADVQPGKIGDLSSVMGATVGFISFSTDTTKISWSDDFAPLAQKWVNNPASNCGIVPDLQHCESPDRFGYSGNPKPKFRVRVGVMTGYAADRTVRPRLRVKWIIQ